jgi:hypothetical protein
VSVEEGIILARNKASRTKIEMEWAFERHLNAFETGVLQPFCDRHNLRFASAMGNYGFCTPGGKVLDPPTEMAERHEYVTGQVKFVNDPVYRDRGPERCRSEGWRDYEPSFFQSYRDVWHLLEEEFGQYVVAFSANDYNSPGYERNLKKIKGRTEE